VTTLGLGLGWYVWQRHIVWERFKWSEEIRARGGEVSFHMSVEPKYAHLSPLPWYRKFLRDRVVVWIRLYPDCSEADKTTIKSLFPEAKGISTEPPSAYDLE
jgi:hypothetical protein